jgi:DNA-binding protein HU-beta
VNKAELIDAVAVKTGLLKKQAAAAVDALFDTVAGALARGEAVRVAGFGTFGVGERAARTARNIRTGEPITVPARRVPVFRPGAELKQAVRA